MTPQPTIEQIVELDQHVTKLKAHIQQVKNDAFKVIADCESMSITLASRPAPSPSEQCNTESFRAIIKQNRAEAAAQARDDMAKEYLGVIAILPDGENVSEIIIEKLVKESLRTEGGEP